MATEKYLIHELAELAQTTVRTIRYYTDEGLLPQPEILGKYAYYSAEHLRRLELIRQMKEAYLPLREIRQKLLGMNEAEISQWQPPDPRRVAETADAQTGAEPGVSAKAYIARLMGAPPPAPASPLAQLPAPPPPGARLPDLKSPLAQPTPQPAPPTPENWQRIRLAPGVELHLQEPLAAELDSRVRQLIRYAQKIFSAHF